MRLKSWNCHINLNSSEIQLKWNCIHWIWFRPLLLRKFPGHLYDSIRFHLMDDKDSVLGSLTQKKECPQMPSLSSTNYIPCWAAHWSKRLVDENRLNRILWASLIDTLKFCLFNNYMYELKFHPNCELIFDHHFITTTTTTTTNLIYCTLKFREAWKC